MERLMADRKTNLTRMIGRALICMAIICTLSGCTKSQFKIRFEFPKTYQGNYLLTYYAWDSKKGFWVEATAAVQEGKAEIDAFTSRPTLVYISEASSPSNCIAVYAEKGDEIVLSGDNPDMLTWSVKGNKLSERWSAWRNANAAALREGRSMADDSEGRKEKAVAEFVKANPGDKLSAYILLTEYNRQSDPEGFLKLWNSLDDKAKTSKVTEIAGSADLIGMAFQIDSKGNLAMVKEKKLSPLVVRSKSNGLDTLRFSKSGGSFLYFYTNNSENRRANVDSVKALVKQYPDSAKRIIADISFEADSIAWTSHLRSDSVVKAVRAWMPRGVADRDAIRMGVSRTPWFIVTDKTGTQIYAGSDISKALAAFRKSTPKKQ